MRVTLIGALLLLMSSPALAKDYYLDVKGNDTTGDGTATKPWKTFAHALKSILPGDTLEVRAGTYAEQVKLDLLGLSTDPVVVRAAPGAAVVIDGSNVTLPQYEGLVHVGGTYVTVDGLEVKASKRAGVVVAGKNNTVRNCKIHESNAWGIHLELADNSVAEGNTVFQNVQKNKGHTATQWNSGVWVDNSVGVKILENTIYNNHGEGLLVSQGKTNEVKGNTVYDNWSINLYTDNTEQLLVDGNFIYATAQSGFLKQGARPLGILIEDTGYGSGAKSAKGVYVNNIVAGCELNLAWYNDGLTGTGLKSVVIGNNTLVQAVKYGIAIEKGSHSGTTIANNIVVQSNTQVIDIADVTGLTFSNNNWLGGGAGIAAGKDDVVQNCQLADINSTSPAGFKISANSPCKDKGIPLAQAKTDFFGAKRPAGSAHDIGAHEVGGTTPPADGGTTTPDGGTTTPDGGTTTPDGGTTKPDTGTTKVDSTPSKSDLGSKSDSGKTPPGDGAAKGGEDDSGCGCLLAARSEHGLRTPVALVLLVLGPVGLLLMRRRYRRRS
jgi:parallel beta-helix repeat protein